MTIDCLHWTFSDMILDGGHTLIAGATGSGKSVLENNLVYEMLNHGDCMVLIDPKKVELYQYTGCRTCIGYSDTYADADKMLKKCCKLMDNRFTEMREKRLKKHNGGRVYIIIDEYSDLITSDCKRDILHSLDRLLKLGRAANIVVIACTQCPSRKMLPAELTLNFTNRIALRCVSQIESKQIIGEVGAEKLPKYGYGLLKNSDGVTEFKIPMISDDEIEEAIRFRSE